MNATTNIVAAFGIAAWALYLVLLGMKAALSVRYARRNPETTRNEADVTVLQPILSGDPFLETALRRNLAELPGNTHFVWLVDEEDAEGQRIAETLGRGQARITLVPCPKCSPDVNPKSAKLHLGLAQVRTDYVAVLDDDAILDHDNIARGVPFLDAHTIYTGLPCYSEGMNLWSSLVTQFVNDNSILTYLPILAWMPAFTLNGMFYVMRTETLRNLGGFEPILVQLCDDYALAQWVRRHGGVIHQGTTPVTLRTTVTSVAGYVRLMHRWFVFANRQVLDQPAGVALLMMILLGLPPILLWIGFLALAGGWVGLGVVLVGLVCRQVLLRWAQRRVLGIGPPSSWPLSVLSELLQPFHLVHALVSRSIRWRTRRIRLLGDGRFEETR